ncbi:substrate-binding periplasmic protein [Zooshikella ganghwensis]|uniref:substrate-binding periplasmic protein n=1 Tax=Zooshikella ganghwensis TaxID=202772 RepID=UPI00042314D5|nr:ABC transporter substrate-binding protein [Zooshikella ganghwensis]
MIYTFVRAVFLFFLSICSLYVIADSKIKLTIGEWPPFMAEGYKHKGVMSHIVEEAFKAEGIEVQYRFYPWKRAYNEAEEGKEWQGTVGWSMSDERKSSFIYTEPVMKLKDVFFHRKDMQFDWKTFDDLKKYRIGASVGYFYGDEFEGAEKEKKIKVYRISKDASNMKKLVDGKIDLFPQTLGVGYEMIETMPEAKGVIIHHPHPIRETDYYLIISKKADNAQTYVDAFNKGMEKIKASGMYEQILKDSAEGKYRQ